MRISDWSSDVCSSDLRTGRVLPGRMVRQGIAGAVEADILGQGDGQLRHRHRLRAAGGAVDDGDRTAPIALTRDTPVAQAVLDPAFAVALGGQAVARCALDRKSVV